MLHSIVVPNPNKSPPLILNYASCDSILPFLLQPTILSVIGFYTVTNKSRRYVSALVHLKLFVWLENSQYTVERIGARLLWRLLQSVHNFIHASPHYSTSTTHTTTTTPYTPHTHHHTTHTTYTPHQLAVIVFK